MVTSPTSTSTSTSARATARNLTRLVGPPFSFFLFRDIHRFNARVNLTQTLVTGDRLFDVRQHRIELLIVSVDSAEPFLNVGTVAGDRAVINFDLAAF